MTEPQVLLTGAKLVSYSPILGSRGCCTKSFRWLALRRRGWLAFPKTRKRAGSADCSNLKTFVLSRSGGLSAKNLQALARR